MDSPTHLFLSGGVSKQQLRGTDDVTAPARADGLGKVHSAYVLSP